MKRLLLEPCRQSSLIGTCFDSSHDQTVASESDLLDEYACRGGVLVLTCMSVSISCGATRDDDQQTSLLARFVDHDATSTSSIPRHGIECAGRRDLLSRLVRFDPTMLSPRRQQWLSLSGILCIIQPTRARRRAPWRMKTVGRKNLRYSTHTSKYHACNASVALAYTPVRAALSRCPPRYFLHVYKYQHLRARVSECSLSTSPSLVCLLPCQVRISSDGREMSCASRVVGI